MRGKAQRNDRRQSRRGPSDSPLLLNCACTRHVTEPATGSRRPFQVVQKFASYCPLSPRPETLAVGPSAPHSFRETLRASPVG